MINFTVEFERHVTYSIPVQAANSDDAWAEAMSTYGEEYEIDSEVHYIAVTPEA